MTLDKALQMATNQIMTYPESSVYIVCHLRIANQNEYAVCYSLKQARLKAAPHIKHCTVVTRDNIGQIYL